MHLGPWDQIAAGFSTYHRFLETLVIASVFLSGKEEQHGFIDLR